MGCEANRCNKDVINHLHHKKSHTIFAKYTDFFLFSPFFLSFFYFFLFLDALKTSKNEKSYIFQDIPEILNIFET